MISFPCCKINLGLNIIGKRDDGYHDIETVFYPLKICDALEVIQTQPGDTKSSIEFSGSGLQIESSFEDNLCVKAYHLLQKDFPELPAVKIHLHKAIPIGAGLGGGSADGAFTLRLLNKKFNLNLSAGQKIEYASRLGSDCPFFVSPDPSFAQGRGELLQQINLDLSSYKFLVIYPGIHINTAWAFSQIHPKIPSHKITEIISKPVQKWKDELVNDFEEVVIRHYPSLQHIKRQLYDMGAIYASMSGSGSTFFGIFAPSQKIPQQMFPETYFVREVTSF